ncbi:MAG: ATP-binding protein [Tepidisphaeraceae bacterium]|jgi:serine/threonine-protein kinase RsbW
MSMAGSNRRGRSEQTEKSRLTTEPGPGGSIKVKADIPSVESASREVQDRILSDAQRRGYNNQCLFAIKLALDEALRNAIKHGNQHDPSKKIRIEATISRETTVIVIEDEGSGFARALVPDPTLEENLEKSSGRGIHLIEAYMNEVRWSRGGRRLRMVKKNDADLLPRG